jgi:hypothetical protein
MPPRSIPRWLRTALVFLASLQAARAGTVEARSLAGHRVEQATATSAPRDPIPTLQEPMPIAMVIALGEQRQPVIGPSKVDQAPTPAVRLQERTAGPHLVVAGRIPLFDPGIRPAVGADRFVSARPEPRGAHGARAPCSVGAV